MPRRTQLGARRFKDEERELGPGIGAGGDGDTTTPHDGAT